MQVQYTKTFKNQYKKLPAKVQKQFDARLYLFAVDKTTPQLRVHPLKGSYAGYWSINVNGDVRAIYKEMDNMLVLFAFIGTHSQLYKK